MDGGWEHAEFRKACSASCFFNTWQNTLRCDCGTACSHIQFPRVDRLCLHDIDFSLVGQVAQQRHGSALQSVLRFSRGCCQCFTAPPTNGCCCQCPWNVFGPFGYPSVGCPPITRFAAHGLSECATETCFCFFAIVRSIRPNQQQQKSVLSPHSRQPCCVSSMTTVFPFGGVAFHEAGCGPAFLSATEDVRTQVATADIGCLFILFCSMSVVTTPSLVLLRN